jgi:DNA replication protein DnaC
MRGAKKGRCRNVEPTPFIPAPAIPRRVALQQSPRLFRRMSLSLQAEEFRATRVAQATARTTQEEKMNDALRTSLRQLRLSGMAETLDVRLQEASGNRLSAQEFLELILKDELLVRNSRLIERRVKAAGFRDKKTLEDFDWHFNTSVKRTEMYELATGKFIRESRDCLFVGPPGIGKSHLVQALGYQLIKQGFIVLYRSIFDVVRDFLQDEAMVQTDRTLAKYLKPDLLIIDDMGMKQLPKRSGEYLFEIIMRRYEVRSTIMTSNRPIEEWGKLLCDVPAATAILDRFLHRAAIVAISGKSYRLKDRAKTKE